MINGFRFWCHKVLPLVYDDSLSYYELLCKVVKHMNEMGEEINRIVTDLANFKTYVDGRFEEIDSDLENYVQRKLDEMFAEWAIDGTLDDMVSKTLEKSVTIPVLYAGDIIIPTTHSLSACVVLSDIGMAYLLVSPVKSYAESHSSDMGTLYAVDLTTNAVATSYPVKCGHGNGMSYNPRTEKLFINPVYTYTSGTEQSCRKIYSYTLSKTTGILDTTSLVETNTPDNNFFASCYNYDDGKLYAFDYSYQVYEIADNMTLTKVAQLVFSAADRGVGNGEQGFAIKGTRIYFSCARGTVYEYNLAVDNDGIAIATKILQNTDALNRRPFGEMQAFTFDANGNMWCAAHFDLNDDVRDGYLTRVLLNGLPKTDAKTPVQYYDMTGAYLNHGSYTITVGTEGRFRNANTEMKHPAQINFMARIWGLEKFTVNSTTDFGKIAFTVPVTVEIPANGTFKFGQIQARNGKVTLIANSGAHVICSDDYEFAILLRNNGEFNLTCADTITIDNLQGHDFKINVATSKAMVSIRKVPTLVNGSAGVYIESVQITDPGLYWGTTLVASDT